jgi:hypothetical protein
MSSRGAVLLPTVIMMGAVLLAIGMAGLAVGVVLSRSNNLIRTSARALAGARGGVEDVSRRFVRDSSWAPTCPPSPTYVLSFNGSSVAVCVNRSGNIVTVQSVGTASGISRRIDANLSIHSVSGKVSLQSSNEVPF